MRTSHLRFFAALAASVVLILNGALPPASSRVGAQQRGRAIDTYAITGARIVTVSGATIERGTLVVRDGLIAAVGANTVAPADARVIDGAGLTVYPGLIDANTTLGIPAPTPTPRPTATPEGSLSSLFGPTTTVPSTTSPNSSQLPGLQPEVLAADIIRPGGEQIEAARNSGLTAALTAPRGNIFLGQSAVINLAGETPQQMIVRSPVALHVGFTPLSGGRYPGSLMGVFASIRQMLIDARTYREANSIYEKAPRGLRRPEQDKSLAALLPALAREVPVVMQAEREREIRRALDLAKEFNLRLIIAGGADSWRVADRLRAENVPVLLSLNFPKRTTAQLSEADPESLRLLREREEAPRTAGKLAAAGVAFAFQSGGMTTMADYLSNAARAVENGLSRDEAIRAMTLRPSEILGLADRLGTIEVGKIANLTVTRGDLFDRNRRITHVFIDGRSVDLNPVTTAAGADGANLSGTWSINFAIGGRNVPATLTLTQQGTRLAGTIQTSLGGGDIANGSAGAEGFRFTIPLEFEGSTVEFTFTGTTTGNRMSGTVASPDSGPVPFSGTKP